MPPSASKRASRRDKRSGDAVPTVTSIANDTIAPLSSETASESLGYCQASLRDERLRVRSPRASHKSTPLRHIAEFMD